MTASQARRDWFRCCTHDPFDRLLAAHSTGRRVPLCTVNRTVLDNDPYLPSENH